MSTQTGTATATPTRTTTGTSTPAETATETTSTTDLELEWQAVAGAKRGNGHHYPAPTVLGDTLIVPSGLNAGIVEGFGLETGNRKWEISFDDGMISDQPYLPTNGSVVVIKTNSGLAAIRENGEIEWSKDINQTGDPLGMDNTIFVPTSTGVEAREFDGSQKWTWEGDTPVSGLGYADGSVFMKAGTSLYSISSGETEWEYRTTIEPSVPPVARDGLMFIGTEDSKLVAINVDESTTEWEQEVENSIAAPITIGEHVYAAGWSYPLKGLC
jgi:outer membrane protein assembly factor BamB